ncbi:unnamed protein product [Soboliphyme baturini]|uniref:Kinesin motor domain-containing protein n=1 Tax=Soboliphyme baturini TaxID=241478 RepID=A0A183IFY5_9BILA|nr:unnamed protein product [Soboliphyme baturini]
MNRPRTPYRTPGRAKEKGNMEPVEVYCRLRPVEDINAEICAEAVDERTLQVFSPTGSSSGGDGLVIKGEWIIRCLSKAATIILNMFGSIPLISLKCDF